MSRSLDDVKSTPIVSIGLPVYNGQRFIRVSIESLLNQSFTEFELIISDNASTDDTEAICREYAAKDSRIRYLRQPTNQGPHKNFDFVMHEAVGTYFMWAAYDDIWDRRFIECLLERIEVDPKCVGAMCPYFLVDAVGNPMCELLDFRDLEEPNRLRRVMTLGCFHTTPVYFYGLFRAHLLKNIHIVPCPLAPKYAYGTEFTILFYLNALGTIRCAPDTRFYHRIHESKSGHTKGIPLLPHSLIRLYMVFSLPAATWKGSRSLLITALVVCLNLYYSVRSIIWQSVRRPLHLPQRKTVCMPDSLQKEYSSKAAVVGKHTFNGEE